MDITIDMGECMNASSGSELLISALAAAHSTNAIVRSSIKRIIKNNCDRIGHLDPNLHC